MGKVNQLICDAWNCDNRVDHASVAAENWFLLKLINNHDDNAEYYCSLECLKEETTNRMMIRRWG